jgi:hypothetical protein
MKSRTSLIIGLGAGVAVLVIVAILLGVVVWRRKGTEPEMEEFETADAQSFFCGDSICQTDIEHDYHNILFDGDEHDDGQPDETEARDC